MAVTNLRGAIRDSRDRITYFSKDLRLRAGSKYMGDSPEIFDHFTRYGYTAYTVTGPIAPDGPLTYTSTGTAVTNPTVGGIGGVLTLTTDDVQNSAEEVATQLAFEIDTNSPLVFEARLKVRGAASSTYATREAFFGWADARTYTSGRAYTVTTGSAITGTNVPTDFAGFAISGVPTSGALYGGGSNLTNVGHIETVNTVDTISALNFGKSGNVMAGEASATRGVVNDVSTYHVYRIEIEAGGLPNYFVDGQYAGSGVAVGTATVPLCAYFSVVTLTGSGANTSALMDIDYIYAAGSSTWAF